ncbi:hypothetical protein [Microbulbifer sp. 2205BS26-8]|uniref:hypothetical protein n=1 Tax=Microbulbifer sp. 2205BS26-8 TaxID=3064386 RepID=UPI00273F4FE8|nr:hypothetical protein [Microbulbifer sp. 2205BS26-8]MDP5209033.1 hypothetical protein [Microbulbifer sp. 2205BS26-8]
MKLANLLIPLVIVCFVGCQESSTHWDGSIEKLPKVAQSCVTNWVGNYYTIKEAEIFIDRNIGKPDKSLIVKSGISGRASYELFGILEMDGEFKTIYISPKYDNPIIEKVSSDNAAQFAAVLEKSSSIESKIIKNNFQNLSHVPCEFIRFSSPKKQINIVYIGLINDSELDHATKLFFDLRKESTKRMNGKIAENTERKIPSEEELILLKNRIWNNLFFEMKQ